MTRSLPMLAKPGTAVATVLLVVTEFLAFVAFTMAVDSSSGMSRVAITLLVCVARAAARYLGFPTFVLSGRPS